MITPIKHAAKFLNGAAFKPSDWGDEGLPIIRIAQLTGKPFDNFFAGEINRGIHVHDGDLLFSWSATIDAFIWQRGDGILNQHIFKVVPKRGAEKQYLYYLIKAHAPRWADDDAHGSTMKHIKKDALSNKVWLPDLGTQKAIADFLDREITRIDALMHKKAILIPLLREKQRSEITLAVTSGIDPKASIKDSDIPWMSSIPEHWTVSKLGYLGRLSNGISIGGDAFGSGFPFVSYGDVYKNRSLPSSASGLVLSSEKDRKVRKRMYEHDSRCRIRRLPYSVQAAKKRALAEIFKVCVPTRRTARLLCEQDEHHHQGIIEPISSTECASPTPAHFRADCDRRSSAAG